MIVISIKICDFVRNNNHYYNETTSNPPKIQSAIRANGRNIKLARKRRKLTAVQVSERAGIARSTLYLIEKGNRKIKGGLTSNGQLY
jgi:DNA-binding XRE family transcriptional regulator